MVLVDVLDLISGAILDLLGVSVELHRRMEGEIARRLLADVEVLVKPAVRRCDQTPWSPRRDDRVFALFPHHGVALARRDDDGAPRTVAVGLLVGARWEHRHVAADLGAGELHRHTPTPSTAALVGGQRAPGAHVRKEAANPHLLTALPDDVCIARGAWRWLGVHRLEIDRANRLAGLAAVGADKRIRVRTGRQQQRKVVVVEQSRRLSTVRVAELVKVVARQQKHAVGVPLEAFALTRGAPDGGGAATFDDIDHLVEGESNRRQHAARRHLADARFGNTLLALQLDEGGIAAALWPPAQLELAQVLDVVAAVDRQVERVHPDVMGELQLPRGRCSDHECNTSFTCSAVRPVEENASDLTTTGTTLAG
jgi:hypothetical protein